MISARQQAYDALRSSAPVGVYGDAAQEYAMLRDEAGVVLRVEREVWRARGDDAQDYLHRMLTQDVAALQPMHGTRGCLLNVKGRVLGDFLIWRTGDAFALDAVGAARHDALPALEKFVITDDVTFEDVTETHGRLTLAGPKAGDVLRASALDVPDVGAVVEVEVAGARVWVFAQPLGDETCYEVLAESGATVAFLDALLDGGGTALVGTTAWEARRIEQAEPTQPFDLSDEVLFNESRLERAVSWNKGCYPGQEPVVMAKHRGRPPNLLVALTLEDADVAHLGWDRVEAWHPVALLRGGTAVGRLTSVAAIPGGERVVALGYVKHAVAEDGEPFEVEGGGVARPVTG